MLRSLALMIILLRAGLSLDPNAIKKLSFVCFRLAFGPCIIEAITVAIFAYFMFNFNIAWSLMLGFVLAAVSPAVVVPGMIKLQETKLGISKGIPTLIIAAASIDDVLAITGFSVCLSFAFTTTSTTPFITKISNNNSIDSINISTNTTESLIWSILKGPTEAVIGVAYGVVIGIIFWYIPEQCNKKTVTKQQNVIRSVTAASTYQKYNLHRFVIFLLTGIFALFGSQKLDLSGAGPLAILAVSFVASLRWRLAKFDVYQEENLKTLWIIFQHFLFSLIGVDVRIKNIQSDLLLYGLLCLSIGIFLRIGAAFLVTYGIGLHFRERLFIAIAWLPKATVQAAIGPVALDHAFTPDDINRGRLVLTVAVLSILITASLGAIAIDYFAPLMLTKDGKEDEEEEEEKEVVDINNDQEIIIIDDDDSNSGGGNKYEQELTIII